jgi:signal peptidase I
MQKEYKPKSKAIALLLNFIAIGAGYFYIGKFKKSLLFLPFLLVLLIFFYYISTLFAIGYIALLLYLIIILTYAYTSYDILKIISQKQDNDIKQNKIIFTFLYIIGIFSLIVIHDLYSPIKAYEIKSQAMQSTIIKGDKIIVIKDTNNISRGNIIAFMYPKNPNINYIKRCVAKGGDIIALNNKNLFLLPKEGNEYVKTNYPKENIIKIKDKLWIVNPYKLKYNGIHNDKNITNINTNFKELFDMKPILIPKNHFFVMGDNRDHSNDSRFWGTVPKEYVIGKVKSIYINFNYFNRTGMIIKR